MKLNKIALALAVSGLVLPGVASATDGYFSQGYGMKAKGMAGASTARAVDAFGGANNPASMAWVGDRLDVGVDWFSPIRSAERTGSAGGTMNSSSDSGSNNFFVPEFGYNKMLNARMSLGVTVYGNGGMNTDYPGGEMSGAGATAVCTGFRAGSRFAVTTQTSFNMLCGDGRLNMDLMQLVIAPTLAYKLNENHSIGISPLFGYQRFKVDGLQGFVNFSASPNDLTNNGYDSSTGWGVRIGWFGKINDRVTLGAAYSSKIKMGTFDKYKGLFAEQGGFDMPENWNVGISVQATPKLNISADYQRINYSGVNSIANPSTNFGAVPPGSLGPDNGRGFGWGDVDVIKLGLEYAYSDRWTLRAGYSHNTNPIQNRDVTFNIIAPGVVTDHVNLGFTYGLGDGSEITMAYMHAFQNSVTGSSLYNNFGAPGGNETIKMHQDSLGIAYGKKF